MIVQSCMRYGRSQVKLDQARQSQAKCRILQYVGKEEKSWKRQEREHAKIISDN